MTPREIAAAVTTGASRFVDLCIAGEVTRRSVWIGMQGAAKYALAIAAGDEAGEDLEDQLICECGVCTARTPDAAIPASAGWCGTPLMAEVRDDGPTCGCLLEAKASVGSETCPRQNWKE